MSEPIEPGTMPTSPVRPKPVEVPRPVVRPAVANTTFIAVLPLLYKTPGSTARRESWPAQARISFRDRALKILGAEGQTEDMVQDLILTIPDLDGPTDWSWANVQ